MEKDDSKIEGRELPKFVDKVSNEAKLKELLRNLNSTEIKLCSDASKEFIKLLKGDCGGQLLFEYVSCSSNCSELLQAWKLGQERLRSNCVVSLISTVMAHPDGMMYDANNTDPQRLVISRALDKFARLIIDQHLGDVYKDLNSKESKHKKAALLLLASIVRRGSTLAADVAKCFDFKFPAFIKLAEYKRKKHVMEKKRSARRSFVRFAMSFLEVGKPGLLRWVLQQREMYSGVLRGLGNDDDETLVYVLSTLRDRVLVPQSLIPPGLRSVLFGSVTLDKLINISSRDGGGDAAELAHRVLVIVCIDPSNGLMPDLRRHLSPLRGNPKRLLDLMKKLKATEVEYHRDLLLAIAKESPSLASVYMDEYPYNLEDHTSSTWFAAVLLAAKLISSVGTGTPFNFLDSLCDRPPSFNSLDVQCVMKCIFPAPFTRLVINKGLLHTNSFVKHVTLKLVLEQLKLLDLFKSIIESKFGVDEQGIQGCASLKEDIQNEARTLLPDPQVLLSLLSSLSSHYKSLALSLKRKNNSEIVLEECKMTVKKLRTENVNEDVDIIVSGVCPSPEVESHWDDAVVQETNNVDDMDNRDFQKNIIADIWALNPCSLPIVAVEDEATHFYAKLLDTLKFYHRTVPAAVEGSFDFFKVMPTDPLSLPGILQQSLLSLFLEVIGWSSKHKIPARFPEMLYKHLQPFINMLLYSQSREIKDQACILAKAAILSTGAFTRNPREVDMWFLFLPSYSVSGFLIGHGGIKVLRDLFSVVVSFLCDAVSTTGNNLPKYWDLMRLHTNGSNGIEDVSPEFSPLVICALEKCLRLLSSESGTFSLSEKTIISLYVCNTIKYILQTQVKAGLMSLLIDRLISKKVEERCFLDDSAQYMCEWRPLMNLLLYSRGIKNQKPCRDSSLENYDSSFINVLTELKRVLRSESDNGLFTITKAFVVSLISTPPAVILHNFPSVLCISRALLGVPFSILLFIFSLEPNFMDDLSKLWHEMFYTGMQMDDSGDLGEEEISGDTVIDSIGSATVAFCSFMREAPYQVLTPMILSINTPELLEGPLLSDMLVAKLSEFSTEDAISFLRLLLFWCHWIRSAYPSKPMALCKSLFKVCFNLIDPVQSHIFRLTEPDHEAATVTLLCQHMVEAAEIICSHPLLSLSLECPLESVRGYARDVTGKTFEDFVNLAAKEMQYMDCAVLNLVPPLPEDALDFLIRHQSYMEVSHSLEHYKKSLMALAKKVLATFRDRFDIFLKTGDWESLAPTLYSMYKLIPLVSPHEMFELVGWMFSRTELSDSVKGGSTQHSAMSFLLWIAACAFDVLSAWLQQQTCRNIFSYIKLWPLEISSFDLLLFEHIYFRVMDIAVHFEMDAADLCLLKAVNVAKIQRVEPNRCLPLVMNILKVILNTPTKLISHFVKKTNRTRAKILSSLIDISSFHLSVFGPLLSNMMNRVFPSSLSADKFLMLLPAVLSCLNSIGNKGEFCKCYRDISSFYCEILLSSFSDWSSFVSGDLFKICDEMWYVHTEDRFSLISGSLLTRTIFMLQDHFSSSKAAGLKLKERLKLFDLVCPLTAYFDHDMSAIDDSALDISSDFVNRIIAKVHFCRMLLFPKANKSFSEVGPNEEDSSRISLIKMLVRMWDCIVLGDFQKIDNSNLCRFLEAFLLKNIMELTRAMAYHLINQQQSPLFIEQLVRSSLLNRFEDPATLKMLRCILTSVSDVKLHMSVLQLLLAHSQFFPTIRSARKSSDGSQLGATVKPMSSILRSLVIPSVDHIAFDEERSRQLEVLKLLRALVLSVAQHPGFNFEKVSVNPRELFFLLLSSYGATVDEIDVEIYNLMVVLESHDEANSGSIAEVDFLWGSAAENMRKEQEQVKCGPSDKANDIEAVEEYRRSQFRENLPIDPKMCAKTVLNFPYNRIIDDDTLQKDISEDMNEALHGSTDKIKTYDPVFILRFSIHCLSTGYIEPLEFASLGLLAIAFITISSPHEEIRKLGYETLGRFKTALEKGQKKKDKMRLRLLLMHIQNGVEESWQRIPSVIAMFAAEASCILLDPQHSHYSIVIQLLMHSPRVNMKSIPLFQSLFWSSSVNFKLDRLWILRLLYAGLNSDDDGQLYIKNSIIQTLLSFYASPLSDNESKELILQVVRKSVKLCGMARYLVEHCGLLSWLSSVVSVCRGTQYQDQNNLQITTLLTILEVVNVAVASGNTFEWLQKLALEQLSELSTHLYKILVGGNLSKEKISVVSSILQILTSTLNISQKREVYQPHLTLSIEGIFHIYKAVDSCRGTDYCQIAELGLKAILMSAPPVTISCMGEEKLMNFLNWATSTALQLDSKVCSRTEHDCHDVICSGEEPSDEDPMLSKFLRWLIASVILQRHSFDFAMERSESKTLLSLLESTKKECGEISVSGCGCEEMLAKYIFHLQQLLGTNWRLLPSVVSALFLLLSPDLPRLAEMGSSPDNQDDLASLCTRIRYPVEVNPAWRWSFDKPWGDPSPKRIDHEKLDELQACESLLLIISNILGNKKSPSRILSDEGAKKSGLFTWVRSLLSE